MIPTTYASVAVLTALAPLVAPQAQETLEMRSYDLSGCELSWDKGMDGRYQFSVCRPFEDSEFLSGLQRLGNGWDSSGGDRWGRSLSAKDASAILLEATGLLSARGKNRVQALVAPPNSEQSSRLLISGTSMDMSTLDANFKVLEAALAPERRLVVEHWRSASDLQAGLLTAEEFAQLTQGRASGPTDRWQVELSPGATAVHDARRFEPMVLDYDVQIATGSFALDEVSGCAAEGARMIARYGGSFGGGWLRIAFELNEFSGERRTEELNLGGWVNAEELSSLQVLPTTFDFQDVVSRGFQLAGFLPEGGAYLIGLGTTDGGAERDWITVRVEGGGFEGVHSLTGSNGAGSTLLIEAEGFTQQGFDLLHNIQEGPFQSVQGTGLLGGNLSAGKADQLLDLLPHSRARFNVTGPFIVVSLDEQAERVLLQQLLEMCAATAIPGSSVNLSGSGDTGGLGNLSLPAVSGVNCRAWSLLSELHVGSYDVEVATNASATDPVIGLDVTGLLLEGRPRGQGWELELWGASALPRESKKVTGWGYPTLNQPALERISTLVRVTEGTPEVFDLGGGPAPSLRLEVR